MTRAPLAAAVLLALVSTQANAQDNQRSDSASRRSGDPIQEGLPLKAERVVRFTTNVGTWMSLDITPDGQTLVFDHLGDLFTLPITGGKAVPLTKGMALDAQPRLSPDGKRVTFVSDRKGASNVWVMSLDKRDTIQISKDRTQSFDSPEWTPDGKYVIASRGNTLRMYHVDGGGGTDLPRQTDQPGIGGWRYIGTAFGNDPRYLWVARRSSQWNYNTPMRDYQLYVYDRESGEYSVRANRWGSAFRPTLSPDGKWLVYGTRFEQKTGLRIRDLATGDERWLAYPVQRDDQESRASRDVLPGMTFTPDSRELIASYNGKIYRVPVSGGPPQEIPFSVDVEQHLGPEVKFDYPVDDKPTFTIRQIRNAVPSPDGKRLAFTALDRLYVMDVPGGTPKRLTDAPGAEFQPAWSPDGQWLAFVTWTENEQGNLWKVRSTGGRPVRLTQQRAYFQQPVWSPDGQRVVAMR